MNAPVGRIRQAALRAALLVPLALTFAPGPSAAGEPSGAESAPRVRLQLAEAHARWRTGRLVRVAPDSLILMSTDGRHSLIVAEAQVARLQLSRGWGSRAGVGAVIGGLAGAGAIAAIAIGLVRDDFELNAGAVTGASLVASMAGAGIGALVGARFDHERWAVAHRPWPRAGSTGSTPELEVRFAWRW